MTTNSTRYRSCKYAQNKYKVFAGAYCLIIHDTNFVLKRYVTFDSWNKAIGVTSDNGLYFATSNYNSFVGFDDNAYYNNVSTANPTVSFVGGHLPMDFDRVVAGTKVTGNSFAYIFQYTAPGTLTQT